MRKQRLGHEMALSDHGAISRARALAAILPHTLDITPGVPLRRIAAFAAVVLLAGSPIPAFAQVTAYEGARLIVAAGRVIETATPALDGAQLAKARAAPASR